MEGDLEPQPPEVQQGVISGQLVAPATAGERADSWRALDDLDPTERLLLILGRGQA